MRFTREGEWTVSTPIYAGPDADVEKAAACPHKTFTKVVEEVREGNLVVMEKCADCIATRVRYKPETFKETP